MHVTAGPRDPRRRDLFRSLVSGTSRSLLASAFACFLIPLRSSPLVVPALVPGRSPRLPAGRCLSLPRAPNKVSSFKCIFLTHAPPFLSSSLAPAPPLVQRVRRERWRPHGRGDGRDSGVPLGTGRRVRVAFLAQSLRCCSPSLLLRKAGPRQEPLGNHQECCGGPGTPGPAVRPRSPARRLGFLGERGGPGQVGEACWLRLPAGLRAPDSDRFPAFSLNAGSGLRTPPKSSGHPASLYCPCSGLFVGLCYNLCRSDNLSFK